MATVINAQTSAGGLSITPDLSGQIALQASGNTIATISSTGVNLSATGLVFSDSTTQTTGKGAAKAWVVFVGSSATINGSFNVSSVTRSSTGSYSISFSTAMSNSTYAVSTGASNYSTGNQGAAQIFSNNGTTTAPTTSGFYMTTTNASASSYQDLSYISVVVFD